jgi:hypothetical protein
MTNNFLKLALSCYYPGTNEEDSNQTPGDSDFSAELIMLRYKGVNEEDLKRINSKASAERLLSFLEKNPLKEEEKDPKKTKKGKRVNMIELGEGDFQLPDPEQTDGPEPTFLDQLKPLRVNNGMKNRYQNGARIMRIYTDEYPEGRMY